LQFFLEGMTLKPRTPAISNERCRTIYVKFCGGCNPVIDRNELVRSLANRLPSGYDLSTDLNQNFEIGIIVCGCKTACADRADVKCSASYWIVAAGETVDLAPVSENIMADVIADLIQKAIVPSATNKAINNPVAPLPLSNRE